jgi:hypothetical protein
MILHVVLLHSSGYIITFPCLVTFLGTDTTIYFTVLLRPWDMNLPKQCNAKL